MKASAWQRFFPAAGLLATAGITSAATGEWWVLGLGTLASVVLALLNRGGPQLPAGLDATHQAMARTLWRAKEQLAAELSGVPESARALLAMSSAQLERIGAQGLALVARHQEMQSYLAQAGVEALKQEHARLEKLAAQSPDAAASERYREAAKVREEQLAHAAALQGHVARLDAELAALQARLEAVRLQVLTLRSAQADSEVAESSQRVSADLSGLSREIGAISESFEELAEAPRQAQRTRNS
jgi:Zn-dependent oligopeptidase